MCHRYRIASRQHKRQSVLRTHYLRLCQQDLRRQQEILVLARERRLASCNTLQRLHNIWLWCQFVFSFATWQENRINLKFDFFGLKRRSLFLQVPPTTVFTSRCSAVISGVQPKSQAVWRSAAEIAVLWSIVDLESFQSPSLLDTSRRCNSATGISLFMQANAVRDRSGTAKSRGITLIPQRVLWTNVDSVWATVCSRTVAARKSVYLSWLRRPAKNYKNKRTYWKERDPKATNYQR